MSRERPLIVLLPGLGLDRTMFEPLARALEHDAEVRAFDLPGFEAFEAPGAGSAHGVDFTRDDDLLERVAGHVADRVDALGRRPDILGGLSLGGSLAIMLKARLRPSALVLFAPGGLRVAAARREAVEAAITADAPDAFVRRSLGVDGPSFDDAPFRAHFAGPAPEARAYYTHLHAETWAPDVATTRGVAYRSMLRAALRIDLEEILASNESPADLVWGEDDRVFSARTRRRYASTMRESRLHVLPGVGHFPPLDAPAAAATVVRARLATL
jgi:pimeloyl-ACP methyl ester carboxylesterase